MRNAIRYRGSILRPTSQVRASAFRSVAATRLASLTTSTLRLGDSQEAINRRPLQYLLNSRRPLDDDAVYPLPRAKPEVQATIILARETRSAIYDATLLEISRLELHFGTDCAPIAARSDELETEPVVGAVGVIAIQHCGLILVGDDDVLFPTIPQIGQRYRAAIVQISRAHLLSNIHPASDTAI